EFWQKKMRPVFERSETMKQCFEQFGFDIITGEWKKNVGLKEETHNVSDVVTGYTSQNRNYLKDYQHVSRTKQKR
ncbi:hypothetical protein PENTCL1PPCAC_21740, partial [Pristionchus entomophagus]